MSIYAQPEILVNSVVALALLSLTLLEKCYCTCKA